MEHAFNRSIAQQVAVKIVAFMSFYLLKIVMLCKDICDRVDNFFDEGYLIHDEQQNYYQQKIDHAIVETMGKRESVYTIIQKDN